MADQSVKAMCNLYRQHCWPVALLIPLLSSYGKNSQKINLEVVDKLMVLEANTVILQMEKVND